MRPARVGAIGLAYPPLMPLSKDMARSKAEDFRTLIGELSQLSTIDESFWAESRAEVERFAGSAARETDVILIVPMTAVPPDWGVMACPEEAVAIVWDTSHGARIPDAADQEVAHSDTASIGALMQGGGLRAHRRRYVALSGRGPKAIAALTEALHVAKVAAQLRTSRVLRIEDPIADYSTLDLGGHTVPSVGLQVEVARVGDVVPSRSDTGVLSAHDISVALGHAIEALADERQCDAVAINCHSPEFMGSEDVGVVACLAASGPTPTACTGDVPTAWLLLLMRLLSGSGIYCEPYTIDDSRGAALLANCGIGMASMAVPETLRTVPSQYYPGVNGRGDSVAMTVLAGDATFVTSRGWQSGDVEVVVCEGRITEDRLPVFGGAHGFFQPLDGDGRAMVSRLTQLGTTHHGVLALGARLGELRLLGDLLGIKVRSL